MADSVVLSRMVTSTVTGRVVPTGTWLDEAGVSTEMRFGLTERTWATTPAKVTRTGSSKPPPTMSTTSPPCGEPVFGLVNERKNGDASPMLTLALPKLFSSWAWTTATPGESPAKRENEATPLASSTTPFWRPLPRVPSSPRVVETTAVVPVGGGEPLSRRVTRTVIVAASRLPAGRLAGSAVTEMLYVVAGGGVGAGGGFCRGSDGELLVQATSRPTRARLAAWRSRAFRSAVFMTVPPETYGTNSMVMRAVFEAMVSPEMVRPKKRRARLS